jgi:hypothetical protein
MTRRRLPDRRETPGATIEHGGREYQMYTGGAAGEKDLGPGRQYDGPKMSRGGMVFWPRASFRVFAELERMDP